MDAFDDHMEELKRLLESRDWESYNDATLSAETYDPNNMNKPDEPVEMEEKEVPVKLNFDNMADGYSLSEDHKAAIIRYVKGLLEDNMDESLSLVDVTDASRKRSRNLLSSLSRNGRRLESVSLPLTISVKHPPDEPPEPHVMKVLDDNEEDLEDYVKDLDKDAFKFVAISTELYDPDMEETLHPVWLIFDNIRSNYYLSDDDRNSIIRFVKDRIGASLDENAFELVKVAYAGRNRRNLQSAMAQGILSLPLLIRIRGHVDVSNYALSYVLQAIRDNARDIELDRKSVV